MKPIILTVVSVCLFHAFVHAADRIRFGYADNSSTFLSLPLGRKAEFFQKHGLQADLIRIRSSVALTALVSGELDYHSVIGPAIAAAIRGVPIKIVACYTPTVATVLIARQDIKSVEALKGKTIGINSIGGGLEGQARLLLKHFGLEVDKDVKLLATGGMESRLTSMKQGFTVATLGSPPLDFIGKKMGFVVLARAGDLFSYPSSGVIATAKKIKERPDEIKRVIKAGIDTNRYIHQNRDGTIQTMIEWMKVDNGMAAGIYDAVVKTYGVDLTVPEDGLRLLIEEARQATKVDRQISVSDVADLSMLREAQRELGIKQ